MGSFTKHFTLEQANKGNRMFIKDVLGKPTEDWIDVLGIDSDAFRRAKNLMLQKVLKWRENNPRAKDNDPERLELVQEETIKLQASVVTGWSFDEQCTLANILKLFKEAPGVQEQVDDFTSKRDNFVLISQNASELTENSNSASISPELLKEPQPSESTSST